MVSNTYCVVCFVCLSSSCVPYVASFSGLSILLVPSVFSNVYSHDLSLTNSSNSLLFMSGKWSFLWYFLPLVPVSPTAAIKVDTDGAFKFRLDDSGGIDGGGDGGLGLSFIGESKYYCQIFKYSQICIKRSPLGQRLSGLIRQVTSLKRFNSYEMFYDRTRKSGLLIQVIA